MIKVSIIVPIYNVENYLKVSLESLLKQTLKEIEIILVNDGSTDNSLDICNEYRDKDSRIKVVDQLNAGVSVARNTGLNIASGQYIAFMDPDDTIEPEMYEKMYSKLIEEDVEIGICNYILHKGGSNVTSTLPVHNGRLNKDEIRNKIIPNIISSDDLNSNGQTIMASVWRLVIRRELINKYNIRFIEGIPLMEDTLFCVETFLQASSMLIFEEAYYHYIFNQTSAARGYKKNIQKLQEDVFNKLESIIKEHHMYNKLKKRMDIRYITMYLTSIDNEVHKLSPKKELEKLRNIQSLCSDNKMREILRTYNTKGHTFRKKMVLFAIKHKIGIYVYLYYSLYIRFIKK